MTNVADHGNNFRVMYVRPFLTAVGDDIPELILNGSYYQLMGYVCVRLDQWPEFVVAGAG